MPRNLACARRPYEKENRYRSYISLPFSSYSAFHVINVCMSGMLTLLDLSKEFFPFKKL